WGTPASPTRRRTGRESGGHTAISARSPSGAGLPSSAPPSPHGGPPSSPRCPRSRGVSCLGGRHRVVPVLDDRPVVRVVQPRLRHLPSVRRDLHAARDRKSVV